jgi:hypothetical protein
LVGLSSGGAFCRPTADAGFFVAADDDVAADTEAVAVVEVVVAEPESDLRRLAWTYMLVSRWVPSRDMFDRKVIADRRR